MKDNNSAETAVPKAFGLVLTENAIDKIIESLGSEISDEQKLRMLAEKLIISETVKEMCAEHQASKIIIHIGQNGDIIPEIHLKGQAATKYLLETKK